MKSHAQTCFCLELRAQSHLCGAEVQVITPWSSGNYAAVCTRRHYRERDITVVSIGGESRLKENYTTPPPKKLLFDQMLSSTNL